MINKWVKFNEGVELMDKRSLINNCNDINDLLEIFNIQFLLKNNPGHIYRALFNYTESTYNEKSISIANYLHSKFVRNTGLHDGSLPTLYTAISGKLINLWKNNAEDISTIKQILIDMLDFYDEIKDDIGTDGYAKKSNTSDKLRQVCLNSLDDDILNFYIIEDYNGINVEIGYPKPMTVELLSRITDELISLCGRVKDVTGLINSDIEFREFIYVTFKLDKAVK
jgi:hypothetical protein